MGKRHHMVSQRIKFLLENSACPQEATESFDAFSKLLKIQTFSKSHENFIHLFGNSRFLTRYFFRFPESFQNYDQSPYQDKEKTFSVLQKEISELEKRSQDFENLVTHLTHYKYREYLRLTIKELRLDDQKELFREMSHLALCLGQSLLKKIIQEIFKKYKLHPQNVGDFAIVSMGKLGGQELNYSSDIDLIGLYAEEKNHKTITNHELFTKIFTKLTQTLSKQGEIGFLYRVDWDLRPEGKTGTLANSMSAMENYYQTFGEDWERQAFIKADIYCEAESLGKEFLKFIEPFIYRKYFDRQMLEKIWDIKSRILKEKLNCNTANNNIKLGKGGIRDAEFLIQGLQLVYGGKNPALRRNHTLSALKKLVEFKIVTEQDFSDLQEGYLFLRRVETALQMEEERQTHTIKNSPEEVLKIARRIGFCKSKQEAIDQFQEKLLKTQTRIYKIFERFYNP